MNYKKVNRPNKILKGMRLTSDKFLFNDGHK